MNARVKVGAKKRIDVVYSPGLSWQDDVDI